MKRAKRKILIIEDNEMNRELLAELLQDEYEVMTAENGEIGYKILSKYYRELSVIFLDVIMPVCDGYEFLKRIQNDAMLSSVPVIVTTGSDNPEDETKCLELGASDFVSKPYNHRVVLARTKSLIKLHESVATLSAVEFDEMTGAYTMPAFYHHAEKVMKESYDMIASDINEFKLINSVYGEEESNKILKYLVEEYNAILDEGIVARSMDKIFCIFPSRNRKTLKEANDWINRVIEGLPIPGISLKFGAYIDIDAKQPMSVICDRVLMAIATIKNDATKNLAFYETALSEKRIKNKKMETDFDQAILNKEFKVFYQPKIDLTNKKIVAAEALVRWIPKDGNIISPGEFIPLFEEDGLIHKLDEYVFNNVCEFQKSRLNNSQETVPISVNLSRSSVYHISTLKNYINMSEKTGIEKNLVPIELTESAAIEGKGIFGMAERLVDAGFVLHMDDFGSGFSSLSTLGTIPFEVLKLDKSLIDQIGYEKGNTILKYTIMIAHDLNMKVVAEGVEMDEQVRFLEDAKCDMIQGYYYSPPVKQDLFEKMLDEAI